MGLDLFRSRRSAPGFVVLDYRNGQIYVLFG